MPAAAAAENAAERAAALLVGRIHGRVSPNAPLSPLTTYQLGGPAALLVEAASPADLDAVSLAIRETGLEVLIVGRGSNMLVSDHGFPGIAVRLGAGFRWARRVPNTTRIEAGAAMPLPAAANLALAESLAGLEFTVAIPASVGGAVRMNAGAHGHSISEVLAWADLTPLREGGSRRIPGQEMGFGYRSTALPPDSIVTAAGMRLRPGRPEEIRAGMREAREWRRRTQPRNIPNAGSVFTNPPGDAAGRLVEAVCGKGMRVGGARVSEVHANFIVTDQGATAQDVAHLIWRIQRMVREETGIELETEVKLIGRFKEVEAGEGR